MRNCGVASTKPCSTLPEACPDLWTAGGRLLHAKADALLKAGQQQARSQRTFCFKPQADPESAECFFGA